MLLECSHTLYNQTYRDILKLKHVWAGISRPADPGVGLQNCWGKQKTDALQGIWHLSFTGASLSGDHSAALQPGWCKSDCAVLPWWVTTQGSHHLNWLWPKVPGKGHFATPAQHQVPDTGAESSRFSLSCHVSYAGQETRTQWAWLIFVTWRRGKGVQTSGRDVMVESWLSAFPARVLEWQELLWHQTRLAHAGAAAVRAAAAACVLCWCS